MKQAVICLGSNLGNSAQILPDAVECLSLLPGTSVEKVSGIYRTKPWGYLNQPDFLNAVLLLSTELSPNALLGACLGIETGFQRRRSFKNAPRTLDVDLILYEGVQMNTQELTLPHPRFSERGFVLVPMLEIFPDARALGADFKEAYERADKTGISLYNEQNK